MDKRREVEEDVNCYFTPVQDKGEASGCFGPEQMKFGTEPCQGPGRGSFAYPKNVFPESKRLEKPFRIILFWHHPSPTTITPKLYPKCHIQRPLEQLQSDSTPPWAIYSNAWPLHWFFIFISIYLYICIYLICVVALSSLIFTLINGGEAAQHSPVAFHTEKCWTHFRNTFLNCSRTSGFGKQMVSISGCILCLLWSPFPLCQFHTQTISPVFPNFLFILLIPCISVCRTENLSTVDYPEAIPSFPAPVGWCALLFFLLSSLQIPLLELWAELTSMCLWRLEFLPLLCPFLLRGEWVKAWILWNCCRLIDERAQNLILLVLVDIISILI